jgi:orotate phosphoribosyltransferase-like protein
MTVHIKLYGSKADRFEEISETLSDQLGYEPSNPEVVGIIMSGIDVEPTATKHAPLAGAD